jgi:hypothetical protein
VARSERDAYPAELERREAELIRERRAKVAGPDEAAREAGAGSGTLPPDTVGFGLSGGGIRSATFSLGLLQALARARRLRSVDFLSTVSGGGYVGSFLGRLFTREWITGPQHVEEILCEEDPAGRGRKVIRWLRENGRYLAPRGSGDLLSLAATTLRNWVAVQVVLVIFVLLVFVALHLVRGALDWGLAGTPVAQPLADFLVCTLPAGATLFWWSPWLAVFAALFALWVVPMGWAYFLVFRDIGRGAGLPPVLGGVLIAGVGVAGTVWYASRGGHAARLAGCAIVAGLALLALACYGVARWRVGRDANRRRNVLSRWLTAGLLWAVAILAWSLLDTVARTLYGVWVGADRSTVAWIGAIVAAFAGIAVFARSIVSFANAKRGASRPGVTLSSLVWVAAVVAVSVWLTAVATASYAVVWRMQPLPGFPTAIGREAAPTVWGVERLLVVEQSGGGYAVSPEPKPTATNDCSAVLSTAQPHWRYVGTALAFLALLSFLFGWTRAFVNMSSMQAFYSARLTRTFLGASNEKRLDDGRRVTETVAGDDLDGDRYWRWPYPHGGGPPPQEACYPWTRGGPLHLLNVTVNETVDTRTGLQNQDRKGTGLALGPIGLSLGVRHHLLAAESPVRVFPEPAEGSNPVHRVFALQDKPTTWWGRLLVPPAPEPLRLGRWVGISGAAFSAAAGAQTTVGMAILAGMFNVRLGYWWDTGPLQRLRPTGFCRWFPVQFALFSELLAQTRGTSDRLWNLSDGGHFENLAGYELIRRRLPITVLVDAEADPDYTFGGLSELIRKARLDFGAEITFLSDAELTAREAPLPPHVRRYFGSLASLRRGKWSSEELPELFERDPKRYSMEIDRSRVSRAHAALATVDHGGGTMGWLVYVKATLMGDESEDVAHYHRAHPEFPHETTVDQFFDEAQWESYRCLGSHIGGRLLGGEKPHLFDHLRDHTAAAYLAGRKRMNG